MKRGFLMGVCVAGISTVCLRFMCVFGLLAVPGGIVSEYVGYKSLGEWLVIAFSVNAILIGSLALLFCWAYARGVPNDPNHCQYCDYDLTGNVSLVCPECGKPLKPALVSMLARKRKHAKT